MLTLCWREPLVFKAINFELQNYEKLKRPRVNRYICKLTLRITLLIFICALFSACFSEGDCLVSATNYMHIQFKKRSNHKLDTSVIFNYIYFGGSDSALGKTQATEL